MNLLDLAEADNEFLIEDAVDGFGKAMTYTSPDGSLIIPLTGLFVRRGIKISESTGLPIAGDEASVTIRLASFHAAAPGIYPAKGGRFTLTDVTGTLKTFVVPADGIMIDRTAGRVTVTGLKEVAV